MAKSPKSPIPIRRVVELSRRSRQAVYKAIKTGSLVEADLFGVKAVVDDHKLAAFVKSGMMERKRKTSQNGHGTKKRGK
jgi:hypothetical protein